MAVRGSEDTGPQLKLDATSQAISGWIAGDWEFNVSFRPKMARSWHPLLKASYDPRAAPLSQDSVSRRKWSRKCIRRGGSLDKPKPKSIHSLSIEELEERIEGTESPQEKKELFRAMEVQLKILDAEDDVRRAGLGALANQTSALETVVAQISQTRHDVRRLQAMEARLNDAERLLVKLEGLSMFGLNKREKPLKAPPEGTNDKEFDVQVQRSVWHHGHVRCSDAMLYYLTQHRRELENAIPYSQVKSIVVTEDTWMHVHKGRIIFHLKGIKDPWTLALNGPPQECVQCIISKAVMCGVMLKVEFEGKSCEFPLDYKEAQPYSDIEFVDDGLRQAEARAGYVRDPGQLEGVDGIQSEAYDIVSNLRNVSQATNEALVAHMGELEKQGEMTDRMRGRVTKFEKKLRAEGRK